MSDFKGCNYCMDKKTRTWEAPCKTCKYGFNNYPHENNYRYNPKNRRM